MAASAEESPSTSTSSSSIVELFDELCFSYGDEDAIEVVESGTDKFDGNSVGYFEIQEYSKALAAQLYWRFRPTWVLVDCHGWPGAEIVAMLACMRLGIPFVPISCRDQHAAKGRLGRIVEQLTLAAKTGDGTTDTDNTSIVAVTCCAHLDPVIGVFQNANVHSIVFLDQAGNLKEPLDVPSLLPDSIDLTRADRDDLYVLFTSGTSGQTPKAVVGSHQSTLQRLLWFQQTFPSLPRIAKRTPLTFVDAIAELLGTLLTRGSVLVAIPPTQEVMDLSKLIGETQCNQITLLPSQLAPLLHYHRTLKEQGATTLPLESLQRIIISGEPCLESLWQSFHQIFHQSSSSSSSSSGQKDRYTCQLINLYGQTETTGDCCAAILTELPSDQVVNNHTVTIGKPIRSDVSIHGPPTTDTSTSEQPAISVKATSDYKSHEMVVSGMHCLANGYLGGNNAATSKETTPSGGFLFRDEKAVSFSTGDIGFCQDGLWYVQGRMDHVRKVNGVWTAPAEVETAFTTYIRQETGLSKDVAAAAAVVDGRVYVLMERGSNSDMTINFSREHMKKQTKLPWNLIPHQVFPCRSLPRTPGTGKVDRAQLMLILQECIQEELSNRTQQRSVAEKDNEQGDEKVETKDSSKALLHLFRAIAASVLMPSHNGGVSSTQSTTFALEQHHQADIDMSKSFVEIGGDSALAVQWHYQLRLHWVPQYASFYSTDGSGNGQSIDKDPLSSLTPADLLISKTMTDVWDALMKPPTTADPEGESDSKRPKLANICMDHPMKAFEANFDPDTSLSVWRPFHASVAFAACVDVKPLLIPFEGDERTDVAGSSSSDCKIIAGCQNGVLQVISCTTTPSTDGSKIAPSKESARFDNLRMSACHHFKGWRLGYSILHIAAKDTSTGTNEQTTGTLFVCALRHARDPNTTTCGAKVVAMSSNLSLHRWTREFDPHCAFTSSPILCDGDLWVTVTSSKKNIPATDDEFYEGDTVKEHIIYRLNVQDGSDADDKGSVITLPFSVIATPVLLQDCNLKRPDGSTASRVLVYASCDWETGLLLVDVDRKCLLTTNCLDQDDEEKDGETSLRFFSDQIGVVYKDPFVLEGSESCLLMADSWGSLHLVNLGVKTPGCRSLKLSAKALSPPTFVPSTSSMSAVVIVGGFDGIVHCVDIDLTRVLWTCNVESVVYGRPVVLTWPLSSSQSQIETNANANANESSTVMVCTTAGDVLNLRISSGEVVWKYRIPSAEILSSPEVLPTNAEERNGVMVEPDTRMVVFGGRDSRLHFVIVPNPNT